VRIRKKFIVPSNGSYVNSMGLYYSTGNTTGRAWVTVKHSLSALMCERRPDSTRNVRLNKGAGIATKLHINETNRKIEHERI